MTRMGPISVLRELSDGLDTLEGIRRSLLTPLDIMSLVPPKFSSARGTATTLVDRCTDLVPMRQLQGMDFLLEVAWLLSPEFAQTVRETVGPGTFWGDLLRAHKNDAESLQRLAESRPFSRAALFDPARWAQFRPHFENEHRANKDKEPPLSSWRQTWSLHCVPSLRLAIAEIPGTAALTEVYPILRCETRMNIERSLLDGETLDQHKGRDVEDYLEDETPEAQRQQAEILRQGQDLIRLAELQVDVERSLAKLALAEQEAVAARVYGIEDEVLAARDGVTVDAIRQRRHRARKKMQRVELT